MICPACHKPMGPRDGVVTDGTTTVHSKCAGMTPATQPPPARHPSIDAHSFAALTADLRAQIVVGIRTFMDPSKWREMDAWANDRAANMATSIIGNFVGDCRNCGAVPLRAADDITEPMAALGAKGG